MVEQKMTELFFQCRHTADGALEELEVAKLNKTLAILYREVQKDDSEGGAPPPEPLPRGSMRYPAFRLHVHRALARLCPDALRREEVMDHLIAEAKLPDEPQELRSHTAASRTLEGQQGGYPIIEEATAEVGCWGRPVQQLQACADSLREGGSGELTRQSLEVAKTLGSLAVESSKQVLETAREYGMSALLISQSFNEKLVAGEAAAVSLLRRVVPERCSRKVATAEELDFVEVRDAMPAYDSAVELDDEEEVPLEPMGPRTCAQADVLGVPDSPLAEQMSFGASGRSDTPKFGARPKDIKDWRFNAGDGLRIDIRSQPVINGPRTGGYIQPGEVFKVSREHRGTDGVLYLQLADGRGWLFESKPGVGIMCTRSVAFSLGD